MKKRSRSQKSQKPTVKTKGTKERMTIGMDLGYRRQTAGMRAGPHSTSRRFTTICIPYDLIKRRSLGLWKNWFGESK
jgi:hypothetical protein